MEPSNFYPSHIIEMLRGLESSEIADKLLWSFHSRIITDPILEKIYQDLDFPNKDQIGSKQVRRLIESEYIGDFPPIDEYFSKDSEPFHLDPDLEADLPKEDLFESKSLSSYLSEETNSTPLKHSPNNLKRTRSKNGLKALSWKVKEIVERLGSSTYQEVADCLVREEIDLKAEKNIRRRVYDALNVLIAVGVLKKYSKVVQPIRKIQINTQEKMKNLKNLSEKFLRLQSLICRNKGMKQGHQNLFLPFSLVAVPKDESSPAKILMNVHKSNACIKLDQKFILKNSEDILKHVDLKFNFETLPREVAAYCKINNNFYDTF
jgi:transcription factor Dp-1/transcription factor Dp-2